MLVIRTSTLNRSMSTSLIKIDNYLFTLGVLFFKLLAYEHLSAVAPTVGKEDHLTSPPNVLLAESDGEALLASVVIPPRPALLLALQREIRQADPEPAKMAYLINRDVAMSGILLKAANSAIFGARRRIVSVDDAISMLGMRQCGAVMTSLITRSLMAKGQTMMARFWDVSEKRANAMTAMARRTRRIAPEVAHGFGLFCDIGIPILKANFPTYLTTLALANREASTRFTEIERDRHGIDHAIVGSMLAQEWDFDADIILAIRLHHSYDSLQDESISTEIQTLIAANLVVEKAIQEFRKETASLEWLAGGELAMEVLALSSEEIDEICNELKHLF